VPWFQATLGTADYFNTCAEPASFVSVPVNFVGSQSPLSGQGYAGAFAYSQNGIANTNSIYREYIEVPLITPLIAGKSYSVSLYVSLAEESGQAIAEIGAHFSIGSVTDFNSLGVLPVIPQVVNPSINLLSSTNSWMLVSGTFTAAGGEDHLTLGNFRSDANTTAVPASGSLTTYAYYYYDDVSVVPLCGELVPNKAVPCGMPWGFDQPSSFDACSGTNVAVTVVGTTANTCAAFFTRTWSFTDLCGNATNWTQAVTIVDPTPLTINCACLSEVAANLLYTNGCTGIVPNLLQFNSCFSTNCRPITRTQTPPPGTIVGGGIHPITVSVVDCSGNSNGCVLPFTVNGAAPVISCPADIVLFTCQPGAAAWFTPVAFGNVGPVICSPPSGSLFPLNTSTLVTCTATNGCGVSATCTFAVTVMTPPTKWPCYTVIVIGIPITPMGTAIVRYLPPLPGGGLGVDFDNLGSSGQDGVRFDLGAAQKFTFSTALDFNAPAGASFDLALPDVNGGPSTPLLTFTRSCQPHCGWNLQASQRLVADTSASYRSIAIGANGELFSSFTQDAAALDANVLASITSMAGATSAVMTVTLDCRTREVTLDFPLGAWTPDAARKGWDGCIYGNGPRGSTTNKNARLILTPLTTIPTPPITTLALLASNLTSMAFDNPAITAMGRKWGDGHVTLMKAYDDGTEQGMEFASFGDGGGVTTDLGHSASFQFRIGHFENGDLPTEEQFYSIRAWPPGPLTNRPAPPPINLRLTHGSTGVACAADFAGIGVSNVTLQLWNGTTLLSEKAHVAATLETPLTTLSTLPTILGCPGLGVLSLSHTNPFTVYSGLDCPAAGCPPGTELRIIPEFPTGHLAPAVFTELQCQASNGTDNLLYHLQRTLDCTPGPLNVVRASNGITLTWPDDGFRLQGAETVNGPWYDLGVSSPVTLPANSNLRAFRLLCD
jgi:hypothetical protein